MKNHGKKMIAPIVVTAICILYFVIYFGFLISLIEGLWRYLLAIIPLVFCILTVIVLIERIKEIKEGEEDDISKY